MGAEPFDRAAQRRVECWTLGLGAAAALVTGWLWGWTPSGALGLGAALSWLNFRWLKQGVSGIVEASTAQAGVAKVRVPKSVYVKFVGRYPLLGVALYVILTRFRWPVLAFLFGLLAVVAAIFLELLYELIRPGKHRASA